MQSIKKILMWEVLPAIALKSEWSIVYIEGSQVIISKKYCIFSLKIDIGLANSADPYEMPNFAAFHLGLQCLPKYPFRGFRYTNV